MTKYLKTRDYLLELEKLIKNYPVNQMDAAIDAVRNCKGTIYTCGNGGSATVAEHFAQDMYKMCGRKSTSLVSNMSTITMIGNDFGWDEAFSYQLRDATIDDVLVVMSGSGNSKNILNALEIFPGTKIGFLGYKGTGKATDMCDIPVVADSMDMQVCEDMFSIYMHIMFHELV